MANVGRSELWTLEMLGGLELNLGAIELKFGYLPVKA
jgi:hypothetical protein